MVLSIGSLLWFAGCVERLPSEDVAPQALPGDDVEELARSTCNNGGGDGSDQNNYNGYSKPKCGANSRGQLLSVGTLHHYSKSSLKKHYDDWVDLYASLGYIEDTVDPGVVNGADTFVVDYCTVDFNGTPIVASGLMGIPSGFNRVPTVMYSHGTAVTRIDTPSNSDINDTFDGPTGLAVFAGHGFIYLAPDLTGFWDSTAPRHRYFHADTEAKSTLDMYTAANHFLLYQLRANGTLFNYGYSQGGHTALAFAGQAEAAGVTIKATSIGGAVVNVEDWYDFLLGVEDDSYLNVYPTYLLVAYDDVYGDVFGNLSDTFQAPFNSSILTTFDMNHTYDQVIAALPGSQAELLTPTFYASLQDTNAPMRVHLRENSLESTCLDGPIQWYHMIDDNEVPYSDAVNESAVLSGCNDVDFIPWNDTDHLNTWHQTMPLARDYFASF